ncbi:MULTISPECIES: helix-turn-helix domain-containing protein [unclassified Streptomyces]|uniref:TetR/AcrR family transcriptional regulator n=1 Tax=unclassified Streptomyces TaxID=2593676 RepID=UPI002ED3C694|nr:TetR/AcrR family transcriptional regulator [Streptomyces sp. NBC_00891]WSY08699.1 TetR/AcrR family transcriptional regulator [Streptomyces sp. NBC_00890]WSZ10322.1 TetR/AcrR family transcriptional regulator [Streptomyces sp. NBC_00869]WSZ22175.1 TetR/AcrR family transcriptional regulator [Streptomyces sp. NBC_00870]
MTDLAPEAPRRLSKGERTRARILDSATELFARSGYLAVSLRDIAAHAGLTHAGLLHHFPGKEALLLDVLSLRDELDGRRLFPGVLAPGDPEPEPAERLRLLLEVVTRNAGTPGLVALYAKLSAEASDPEHPAHPYFVHRYQVLRRETTGLLAELFAAADARDDPAAAAQQLLALMDGLQTQWLLEPEAVDMAEQVRAFLRRYGVEAGRG